MSDNQGNRRNVKSHKVQAAMLTLDNYNDLVDGLNQTRINNRYDRKMIEEATGRKQNFSNEIAQLVREEQRLLRLNILNPNRKPQLTNLDREAEVLMRAITKSHITLENTSYARRNFDKIKQLSAEGDLQSTRELKQNDNYNPAALRDRYQERILIRTPQAQVRTQLDEKDSSYARYLTLRRCARIAFSIAEASYVENAFLSRETKNRLITELLTLTEEATAMTLFFPYSSYETRQLLNELYDLANTLNNLWNGNIVLESKDATKDTVACVWQKIEVARDLVADAIKQHDKVADELSGVRRRVRQACADNRCLKVFESLLSSSVSVDPEQREKSFEMICSGCMAKHFTVDNLTRMMRDHSGLPSLDLFDISFEEEKFGEGGFSYIYAIDPSKTPAHGHEALKQFVEKIHHEGRLLVKIIDEGLNSRYEGQFCMRVIREMAIWNKLRHDNIVPLLGIGVNHEDSQVPCAIMPLMVDGDLWSYLYKRNADIDIEQRLNIMRDIAGALQHMHTHPLHIIHGDLKVDNVLIKLDGTTNYKAYLTDFGLSSMFWIKGLSTDYDSPKALQGNANFMAPEHFPNDSHKQADIKFLGEPTAFSDMFSFGMLFYTVLTGTVSLSLNPVDAINMRMNGIHTPDRHPIIKDKGHWGFMQECWHKSPALRPSAHSAYVKMSLFLLAQQGFRDIELFRDDE